MVKAVIAPASDTPAKRGKSEASSKKGAALSMRDNAYEEIKRRIITLAYQPGAYVNEAQICQDLDIGRTPVHMALERLVIDGMIEVIPRKGVIVRPVTLDEIRSIIETRLLNEPAAVKLATIRASDDEIKLLQNNARDAQLQTKKQNTEELMRLDREFHSIIADATRNRVLAQILKGLHERSLRLWFISLSDSKRQHQVAGEHENILKAIVARAPQQAEEAMREHIESFSSVIGHSI
jgi:DNA-binding GntR family transcriptional regulator